MLCCRATDIASSFTKGSRMTRRPIRLLPKCVCGHERGRPFAQHDVAVVQCGACGVIRQDLAMTEVELAAWYRGHYLQQVYSHTFEHDVAVAKKRLDEYALTPGARLLDVGCGNGAFVTTARSRGFDAWGQDLSESSASEFVYTGTLESVAFPSNSFDVVTVHDVLEHLPDPLAFLREIRRILKRPGKLIIDFPRFHHPEGRHHWKQVEHLWMLTEEQLVELVKACGFHVWGPPHNPIPSKVVVVAEPTPEKRPQVLVPAGIGDSYWVMTKLPGFLRHHGFLQQPDVWVQDAGGPKRTQPFLRNLPLVHAAGYRKLSDRDPIFHEAYMGNGRTVFDAVREKLDVDYFIAYNGVMRHGRSLEEVDPEFGCDWYPKIHVSKEALKMREVLQSIGPYVLTYYAEAGMYRRWLTEFTSEQIEAALKKLELELGLRIVFMGAPWDRGQIGREIAQRHPEWMDLIGATSFDQMLGAIMGATAVVGFPAGNTILATVLNVPTVLLWNKYFHQNFWKYSCPPNNPRYEVLDTAHLTPDAVVTAVRRVMDANAAFITAAN